jgi:8-oxo-dGTP diphosphatase
VQVTQPNSTRRRGVVAVVFRQRKFLVIKRSAHVVAPGAFCFPGGGIEAGELAEQALVREFQEELNTTIAPVRHLWTSVTRWQVDLDWWLGQLDSTAQLLPNPAEVESVHWLTPDQMLSEPQLLASNRDFLRALAAREIVIEEDLGPSPG